MTRILAVLLAAATLAPAAAQAQTPPAALPQAYAPLFAEEVERARRDVDASIKSGINVPVPKDPGGGFTHEQHKRNYRVIFEGGQLFRLTGEARYRDHVRDMLLAYADLYPGLGPHPAAANQVPGRLFWQSLNDSVFLVNAVQGYAEIRDALPAADRQRIDDRVIRPMARFLSDGSPEVIDRIHNHATWAAAGVGLSGYLLGDRDLVDKALLGLDKSGKAGFLRQLDLLFSPDGYYAEGPYYQRYALQPFVVFAAAIAANDPDRRIFEYRDGIVLKAIRTAIDVTHDGFFLPINDAMPDKSLRTEELYHAVAIAYGATKDPAFLSIADWQGRTVLTPAGQAMAADLAAGKAKPWPFGSRLLSDGPDGKQGALVLLRTKADPAGPLLVAKNTVQGMGHGHFDRLGWLYYDETGAVVTDYGAARFLNVEAKRGGRYLPENDSWASATIAHNTLVVDEQSHFAGDWKAGEKSGTRQLAASLEGPTRYAIGAIDNAYRDVAFRRALLLIEVDGLANPLTLDILHAAGNGRHVYDLPLHFSGHIIDSDIAFDRHLAERPVLGKANGYQHLWVDGEGAKAGKARLTWMQGSRFYSYHMLPPAGARFIVAESGANDPEFNLRREPTLIQRVEGAGDATFVSLLEPHGAYDASAETVVASSARVAGLDHRREKGVDLILVTLVDGRRIAIAVADDVAANAKHSLTVDGRTLAWTGPVGRLDLAKTGAKKMSQIKGRFRWCVIALIALATVINYIDRNALAVMWPEVSKEIGATKEDYALLVTIFMIFYAFGQSLFGRIFDAIGTRMGFTISIVVWSLSIAAHALVRSMPLLMVLRATLGISEAGNWPGAAKANALWFPSRERALAQGIFNAGASLGGIVSAPLIALLFVQFGWHGTFLLIGILGFIWLIPWLWFYKADPDKHPGLSDEEREYILTGRTEAGRDDSRRVPLGELLRYRQSWGVILSRFFLDPVWWLFVSWLPIYLAETFGFDVKQIGLFAWVPFVGAMLGSLFGGWLAGRIISRGGGVHKARTLTIAIGCAIMLPALLFTIGASEPLTAVLLIACILFGFQMAIGNIQTLPSDFFGGGAVGSLAGISGTAAVAGTLITTWLVPVLTTTSYAPIFALSAAIVPISFLCFWLVGGRVAPVALKPANIQE